jgi:hypothetical protein
MNNAHHFALPHALRVASLLAAAALLGGCAAATSSPDWDSRFGDAARQVRAAQVIDPQAPARNTDIQGIDGKAAAGAMKGYAKSYGYAVEEPKNSLESLVRSLRTTGER